MENHAEILHYPYLYNRTACIGTKNFISFYQLQWMCLLETPFWKHLHWCQQIHWLLSKSKYWVPGARFELETCRSPLVFPQTTQNCFGQFWKKTCFGVFHQTPASQPYSICLNYSSWCWQKKLFSQPFRRREQQGSQNHFCFKTKQELNFQASWFKFERLTSSHIMLTRSQLTSAR